MQDIFSMLKKASVFLMQPGNLLYWLLPVASGLLVLLTGASSLITVVSMLLMLLMMCKLLDSAARIIQGLGSEAVPLAPLSVLSPQVAGIVLAGALLLNLAFSFIAGMLGMSGVLLSFGGMLLSAFLIPLWLLSVSYTPRVTTLFSASEMSGALARLGVERYLLAVGVPLAAGMVLFAVYQIFLAPLLQSLPPVHLLILNVLTIWPTAVAMIAWAYLLEGEEAEDADFSEADFADMDFSDIVMDSNLLAAMAEGRADDIPEGDISPVKIEKNPVRTKPARREGKGLLGRLRKQTAETASESESETQVAESVAALAPMPEQTPAPKRERKALPPDMSLLADADVRGMDVEAQLLFVRDLMDADRLWQDGDLQGAEGVLQPYTDFVAEIPAYFPAFKRLEKIYRQRGAETERHALHARLLAAAAQGFQPAYHVVASYVPQHAVAALEADWILPLAQYAAAEGHYDNVLHLTKNFARNHPHHHDVVDNYFLAARALEKLGNLATAEQLLAQLLQRYPDHGKIAQVRATHGLLLEKMKGG